MDFLLKCLLHLMGREPDRASQLSHLLLEIVPSSIVRRSVRFVSLLTETLCPFSKEMPKELWASVVDLFEGYCRSGQPRLAVKVVTSASRLIDHPLT